MRLTQLVLAGLLCVSAPLASMAAGGGATSVRAISFVASHEKGPTDPRLAPYESVLRSNLRFESFRYIGESSASVSPGGKASLSVPGGGRIELEGDQDGSVKAHRAGTVVQVSRGRPSVFVGGGGGKEASGVIVMAQ